MNRMTFVLALAMGSLAWIGCGLDSERPSWPADAARAEEVVRPAREMLDASVRRVLDHGADPERVEAWRARVEARIHEVGELLREQGEAPGR